MSRKIELSESELALIIEALDSLRESRESEIYWSGNDPDIAKSNLDCISEIDCFVAKLKNGGQEK